MQNEALADREKQLLLSQVMSFPVKLPQSFETFVVKSNGKATQISRCVTVGMIRS
jgi:hypothetical protein